MCFVRRVEKVYKSLIFYGLMTYIIGFSLVAWRVNKEFVSDNKIIFINFVLLN